MSGDAIPMENEGGGRFEATVNEEKVRFVRTVACASRRTCDAELPEVVRRRLLPACNAAGMHGLIYEIEY